MLSAPKPWALGEGYEQGDPGWYIYSLTNGLVVLVLDDDAPLTRDEAELVFAAILAATDE